MAKLQELIEQFKDEFSVFTEEEINETYKKYKSMYNEDMFSKIIAAAMEDEMLLVRGYDSGPAFSMIVEEFFDLPSERYDDNLGLVWIIESAIYDAFFDQFESGKFNELVEELLKKHKEHEKDMLSKSRTYNSIYLDGNFKWYHDDGSLLAEGIFDIKNDIHERKYYYKSGNLKCHVKFNKYGTVESVKDFDESGNTITIEGTRYF